MQNKEIEEEYHILRQIDAERPCIERIYLSYGWNIQFQKRHNNT